LVLSRVTIMETCITSVKSLLAKNYVGFSLVNERVGICSLVLSELQNCVGLHFHQILVILDFNFLCFVNIITGVVVIVLTFSVALK